MWRVHDLSFGSIFLSFALSFGCPHTPIRRESSPVGGEVTELSRLCVVAWRRGGFVAALAPLVAATPRTLHLAPPR